MFAEGKMTLVTISLANYRIWRRRLVTNSITLYTLHSDSDVDLHTDIDVRSCDRHQQCPALSYPALPYLIVPYPTLLCTWHIIAKSTYNYCMY